MPIPWFAAAALVLVAPSPATSTKSLTLVRSARAAQDRQPALPDTQPAKRARELVDLINAGKRADLMSYARSSFVPEMLRPDADSIVDFLFQQHTRLGGFEIRRTIQSSEEQINLLVRGTEKRETWLRMNVNVEGAPPHRVRGFFLFAASAADDEADDGKVSADELPRELERYVDALAKADDFAGAVLLARAGKPLLRKAWGEADRACHAANRVDTRFQIASLGKMFTAVAISQLVDQQKLAFDDVVSARAPGWLAPEVADQVTIEMLLTHTSGLGDYLAALFERPRSEVHRTLADYRSITLNDRPVAAPGTEFRYSNTGYLLLGAVIESVAGQGYEEYLRDHVFSPAGMKSTGLLDNDAPIENRARGYYRADADQTGAQWRANDALLGARGTPAGGAYSTVDDLLAFANALRSGELLSAAARNEMLRSRVEMAGTGLRYAHGFTVARGRSGDALVGHEGGFPGVSAVFEVDLAHDYTLIVLSNMSDAAPKVSARWHELLGRAR